MAGSLPHYPSFDYASDKSNAGPRWERWVDRLENLFVGLKIDNEDRKRALLLHYAGETVYDIYDAEKGETEATYAATKQVLKTYFEPKKNTQMEVYKFRSYKQNEGQSLDEFVTELRKLAKTCEFQNVDSEILSQVIQNCRSNRLRRRALREPDKTLNDILTLGRTLELSDAQATEMERQSINKITAARKPKQTNIRQTPRPPGHTQRRSSSNKCRNCGGEFPHRNGPCPAKGKICNACNKPNHYAKVCRGKQGKQRSRQRRVNEIQASDPTTQTDQSSLDSSEEEYLFTIKEAATVCSIDKSPMTLVKLNTKPCKLMIDTGATVNILDNKTYKDIGSPELRKSDTKLLPYGGGRPLKIYGTCEIEVEAKYQYGVHTFYVVEGCHGALIGYKTATQLGLVKIIKQISKANTEGKYPNIFKEEIGKYKGGQVKLHIDPDVQPVAQRNRRTPFHLRPKVEKEIHKLLDQDIIEKVGNTPTPWVSPIVTPPKKNPEEIRLCVDMREANKAIIRERHLLPTIEEIIHDLNGASTFSKVDLRSGYHQLELDKPSRYITTFSTHLGLFRYKRLNFGISSASEIFQETVRGVIQNVSNAKNISDDIIVYGKTQQEHDKALDETMKALERNGLTVNKDKCEFNKSKITFFGIVFSKEGISPDPKKVQSVKDAQPPTNVSEMRSLLGMTNYSSRFIKNYAAICEPLRRLTRQETTWEWNEEHQQAFDKLKQELSSETVMTYYNPKLDIDILVDGSPVGLGAILSQKDRPIAYASRALTDVESRYSQTEREALAIVWACEHFDIFIRGATNVNVITDHKPLEKIWQKPKIPLRIERWGLRLQPYKLTIRYRPGHDNPADYMSRHPINSGKQRSHEEKIAEQYVNFIASEAVPRAMTLNEVKCESLNDKTIQQAIEYTRNGKWFELKKLQDSEIDILELQSYRSIQDELVIHNENILMRGNRIVMPRTLRDRAVRIAHEGHQGISKTKAFIRSKIWFPGINDRVDTLIKDCLACQAITPSKQMEPLKMSELPGEPWSALSADFCGPLPSGDYLFVITDEYSRYPIVEIVKSVSANTVIPVLDKVLSEFGIPKVIKTDNGSPFQSHQFHEYARNIGFTHRRVTPRWPRANAQAEAFNKPLMKNIKTAEIERKNWKQSMFNFLRQYRTTPHTSTGATPFKLLFGRESRTKLPTVLNNERQKFDELARQNDEQAKTYMKQSADIRNKAKPNNIKLGDTVLIRNESKENKLTPVFNPVPQTVVKKNGVMITVSDNDKNTTRNASFFKPTKHHARFENLEEEEELISDTKANDKSAGKTIDQTRQPSVRPKRMRKEPSYLKDYVK